MTIHDPLGQKADIVYIKKVPLAHMGFPRVGCFGMTMRLAVAITLKKVHFQVVPSTKIRKYFSAVRHWEIHLRRFTFQWDKPFYLIAFKSVFSPGKATCQDVYGAVATVEYIKFGAEQGSALRVSRQFPFGADSKPPYSYYCYYSGKRKERFTIRPLQ